MRKYVASIALLSILFVRVNAQVPAQSIPGFEFYKLNKTVFTNKDLPAGKMLFFFYFDPDCEHCQQAMKNLDRDYQNYKNASLYLISNADQQKIESFIDKYGPALKNKQNVTILQDTKNEFMNTFKPTRFPSMYLYSPKNKLVDYEDNELSMFRFLKYLKES